MKKVTINFLIDAASFQLLLGLIVTGFIVKYVLPPGSGGQGRQLHGGTGREQIKTLLSMGRHQWGDIHFYIAVLFVIFMILHVILHWSWIKAYLKSLFKN